MKNVLFIFAALFAFGCSVAQKPQFVPPSIRVALDKLPADDSTRQGLEKIAQKHWQAKEICARKIGETDGDRNKLYDILSKCADFQSQLLKETHVLRGWLWYLQYEVAFITVINEIRTMIRFYSGAQQCVKISATQKEFDTCILNLQEDIRRHGWQGKKEDAK